MEKIIMELRSQKTATANQLADTLQLNSRNTDAG
jgi:hypothetical protein